MYKKGIAKYKPTWYKFIMFHIEMLCWGFGITWIYTVLSFTDKNRKYVNSWEKEREDGAFSLTWNQWRKRDLSSQLSWWPRSYKFQKSEWRAKRKREGEDNAPDHAYLYTGNDKAEYPFRNGKEDDNREATQWEEYSTRPSPFFNLGKGNVGQVKLWGYLSRSVPNRLARLLSIL